MDTLWRTTLWSQFGAAIDTLENALLACPDALWHQRLWSVPADDPVPPDIAAYWYLIYHALFWLDYYLSDAPQDFAPPAPFTLAEFDPAGVLPERPYTREELHTYLTYARQKCQSTLAALTDERARQPIDFWGNGQTMSRFEWQLYNMRHVQEHASQLHLLLGQHAIPVAGGWVARARDISGSQ
ncbi:MAG TPA: DinB family protein [Ktedonobacterales bacterium]|jgi:hypothetical protein|nr:DinB family protein [Ktedonobacterales bacterium]